MRTPTRERARLSDPGPNDGLGYLRFPTRKASLDLALLGLIAEVPGVSGYDIMKIFDLSMAHYWHAHPTQIYPTLDRMEEFGLIKRRNVVQRNRPNKRLYTITPSGERHADRMARESVRRNQPEASAAAAMPLPGASRAQTARSHVLKEERRSWAIHLKRYREIEKELLRRRQGLSRRERDVLDVHPEARHRLDAGEHQVVRVGDRRDRSQSRVISSGEYAHARRSKRLRMEQRI